MDFKGKIQNIKEEIGIRAHLVKASIVNTFHEETAYTAENWSNLLSTFFYTATYIIFINVLFSNVNTIAGYSKDEMLFLTLIAQTSFYSQWFFYILNVRELQNLINFGELDLILSKPVPAAFYVSFRKIRTLAPLRDGIIPIATLAWIINWENIHIDPGNLVLGILISILGFITNYCIIYISTMISFWLGRGQNLFGVVHTTFDLSHNLPFEGYTQKFKNALWIMAPVLIEVSAATSVMLGKINVVLVLIFSIAAVLISVILKDFVWRLGLRRYGSASS